MLTTTKLQRNKIYYLFLMLLPFIIYTLSTHTPPNEQSHIFAPASTVIGLPDEKLHVAERIFLLLSLIITTLCIIYYIQTRSFRIFLIIPLISFLHGVGINKIAHLLFEIKKTQYQDIQSILLKNPNLVSVLPNYVNASCEMKLENYENFKTLALLLPSQQNMAITALPIKHSMIEVKKLCAGKINI